MARIEIREGGIKTRRSEFIFSCGTLDEIGNLHFHRSRLNIEHGRGKGEEEKRESLFRGVSLASKSNGKYDKRVIYGRKNVQKRGNLYLCR